MRLFWQILAGIGGLVLLLLIAIAIAVSTVDVKSFIGPIQKRVKDATGRDLTIGGNIDFKLSLEPKLVVQDVALSNAPWAKSSQMLTAKRVEAQFALLPLLHRDFQVRSFALIEPTIALETDAKGAGNWDFGGTSASTPAAATPDGAAAMGGLFVGDLSISNGVLTYRDGESGKVTTVTIADLALNARDPQSAVSARFRGSVDDISIAVEGDLGPLTSLVQRRWPYPVSLKGQVDGQQASVDTKLRVQDSTIALDPLELGVAKSKVTGKLTVTTGKPRPKLVFKLASPSLALAELALPAKGATSAGAKSAAKAAPKSRFVFSEDPIDLSGLKSVDASGDIAVETLVLPDGRKLDHVQLQLALQNGMLDAPVVQAGIFGGKVSAHVKLDANRDKDAALNLHLDASGLDLAAILAESGIKREVRGGKTSVNADIAARGGSLHQWASSASGTVTAIVGPASMGHPTDNSDATFNKLAEAVNPFRKVDPSTELQCAVIRLPLASGIAKVERSIAFETNKLGATASGTVDFRDETLDLSIKPQLRKGITLNIDQFASLVRFHGSFNAPTVGIDAKASAETVATLGAAIATGGTSLLGQVLFKSATADTGAPCQIALGRAGSATEPGAAAPATDKSAPASNDLGKALGKMFGR
jgi:AsmA family protein